MDVCLNTCNQGHVDLLELGSKSWWRARQGLNTQSKIHTKLYVQTLTHPVMGDSISIQAFMCFLWPFTGFLWPCVVSLSPVVTCFFTWILFHANAHSHVQVKVRVFDGCDGMLSACQSAVKQLFSVLFCSYNNYLSIPSILPSIHPWFSLCLCRYWGENTISGNFFGAKIKKFFLCLIFLLFSHPSLSPFYSLRGWFLFFLASGACLLALVCVYVCSPLSFEFPLGPPLSCGTLW